MQNRFASFVVGALALFAGLAPSIVSAGTIYFDSFNRTGPLSGSSPTVDTPGQTYTSSSGFATNGTSAVGSSAAEAYLPVTLAAGTVYTLSATMTPTANSGDDDWLALGFTGANGLGSGFFPTDGNAQLWLLYRESGGTQSFYNGGTSNGAGGGSATAGTPDTFTITLDSTTGAFTMSDTLALISRTGTLSGPSLAAINGIGISTYSTATGNYNNLSLTTPVPEPVSLVLFGLGAVGLLAFARRRR